MSSLPMRASACVYFELSQLLGCPFLWREWTLILSPHVSRAVEYAGCLCCPSGCSAFLALSYNGGLEHCDVIKPFKLLQLEFHLRKDELPDVGSTGQDWSSRDKRRRNERDFRAKVTETLVVTAVSSV